MNESELDAQIGQLEAEMPHLQQRHRELFSFANAWAQRYDAILARVPYVLRERAECRLHRLGIRWGVASEMRMAG